MIKTGTPKCLWDHSLELEVLIRSTTAIDYHILDGKVPNMLMTGQADDISHIREYTWFYWVIFCDGPHVSYTDNHLVLGRYLGPTLDIRNFMCAKILKKEWQNSAKIYSSDFDSRGD